MKDGRAVAQGPLTETLARLTRHSANRRELASGQQVWVQVKAVARLG